MHNIKLIHISKHISKHSNTLEKHISHPAGAEFIVFEKTHGILQARILE